MPDVGEVIGFPTTRVIGKDKAYKYQLCVCAKTRQYIFVCGEKYSDDDYPLPRLHCSKMPYQVSYLSIWKVMHIARIPKGADRMCILPNEYLEALLEHVRRSDAITEVDRRKVVVGVITHLTAQNA
jgi:hypothetical protein